MLYNQEQIKIERDIWVKQQEKPRSALYKVPISVYLLEEGMIMAETFHVKNEEGVNLMFSSVGTKLTARHIEKLMAHRVKEIKIFSDTPPLPTPVKKKAATNQAIGAVPKKPQVSKKNFALPEAKPTIKNELRDQALISIKNLFDATKDSMMTGGNMTTAYQAVKDVDTVVYQLVNAIKFDPSGLVHINNLKSYDEYTYHHSLSVAVLSVAIGQTLGLGGTELRKLCRCAILHDIGKIFVPIELITKPGKLDLKEFDTVKDHALRGGQYLKNGTIGSTDLWIGIMYHHEKVDGTGYPRGLKKNEIPLFSRIISVADVYDALTSLRPYRSPMTPCGALEVVMSEAGTSFDIDVVQAFKLKLELYPINTMVELSDGRIGIVVENANAIRPVIQIMDSGETVNLADLNSMSLVITKVHNPNESPAS